MQEFTLRKATNNDSDFFYQVKKTVLKKYIEEIWGWNEDFQIQFHKENFHVDETQIVIVDENNAGTVEVKEDAERIFISSLYILPQYQHNGIGTAICNDYICKAEREKKRIELEVLKINIDAQRLYKRLGFTLTEKDDTKYFMFKDLKK